MTSTLTQLPKLGDWHDLDELAALQRRQLPTVLDWASRSSFYRQRLGDDLRSTPLDAVAS